MHATFGSSDWQMSLGERAAVEGVLSFVKPRVAVEIGSAAGGSLDRALAHSQEVHSFDLVEPTRPAAPNLVLHTGDSHELLAPWLAQMHDQARSVDYAMVDGDHSSQGVYHDLSDLLDSKSFCGFLLAHDAANPAVRAGLRRALQTHPRATYFDLDFVPGRIIAADTAARGELWGGLALAIVDSPGTTSRGQEAGFRDMQALMRLTARLLRSPEAMRFRARTWLRAIAAKRRR